MYKGVSILFLFCLSFLFGCQGEHLTRSYVISEKVDKTEDRYLSEDKQEDTSTSLRMEEL